MRNFWPANQLDGLRLQAPDQPRLTDFQLIFRIAEKRG
jgi:hypothetical protein